MDNSDMGGASPKCIFHFQMLRATVHGMSSLVSP